MSEKAEEFILECANKWGFYKDFYYQDQLESAIKKYDDVKRDSVNEDPFIRQCTYVLKTDLPIYLTYYVCLKISFLNESSGIGI